MIIIEREQKYRTQNYMIETKYFIYLEEATREKVRIVRL